MKKLILIFFVCALMGTCKRDEVIYTTKNVAVTTPAPPFDSTFALQIYPNPFTGAISFDYTLPDTRNVEWLLADLSGRIMKGEYRTSQPAGYHKVTQDFTSLPSGIYLVIFRIGEIESRKKIVKVT